MKLAKMSRSTQIFIGLIVLYVALTFILPTSNLAKAAYHLSDVHYYLLLFVVKLPIVAFWCIVFGSYRSLHDYVVRIKDSPEGKDFAAINRAMFWIAWGLPVPAIITSLISGLTNYHPDARIVSLIIGNYLYVIVSVLAFSFLSGGAHRLAERAGAYLSAKHIRFLILTLVSLAVLFCYIIAHKLHGSTASDTINAYYLPNFLVWASIVVPYLYAWFVGIFAAMELVLMSRRTPGIIYRQGLQFLAVGIVVTIISLCMFQYFRSVIPRTGILKLGGTLLTTYGIYAINAVGSVLLIIGARRLKKIEDI